ncbi:hypothetical protein TVAG_111180 [Trichomonas vaginalis G3]|uniref:Uncharacterized protein n=1 Tax=Trichomonas vaginalis (strain ATCC PRA-98 / G3) TaxID=412133 RepID=A2EZX7_TRIV3|nr:hypothetical protein TVAGG3_0145050 [Trichomonas vaginalis G3]EAY01761.1 hypothetical protein TVAG_111180 [Trichomonas vaginalis G3]KAI5546858.1 hypothetical protein TVAGG3_0145050 [Trichomonas vaginalis G3]|eukprot:XP_001314319.1 hypothetical protein [Trichomonas vaginalis G3]
MEHKQDAKEEEFREMKDAIKYAQRHIEAFWEYCNEHRNEDHSVRIFDVIINFYRRHIAADYEAALGIKN